MGRVKGTIQPVHSGVLVDKSEGPVACFGEYAPQDAVRAWGSAKAAKQLNFEAEDMPFVSALNWLEPGIAGLFASGLHRQ